jgi:hypothetical protein
MVKVVHHGAPFFGMPHVDLTIATFRYGEDGKPIYDAFVIGIAGV